jgi:GntR family transcriptional regulator
MRLWLSKNSDVPIREQLVTQIVLGIVSNDLKAKQRLPSTRDLARRYSVHANTVSAAYRELARRGWVEFRKGSGVYVRPQTAELDGELGLDQMIARFLKDARSRGYSLADIQAGVQKSLGLQSPDHFLVLEPNEELRAILVAEIRHVTRFKVQGLAPTDLNSTSLTGAVPVALYGHFDESKYKLGPTAQLLVIHSGSIVESLKGQTRPSSESLVAIVSRWPEFLKWARTVLLSVGLDADALSLRDARERGWEKGLRSAAFVITDSLMAPQIPHGCPVKVFRVTSEASLKEIRDFANLNFVTHTS